MKRIIYIIGSTVFSVSLLASAAAAQQPNSQEQEDVLRQALVADSLMGCVDQSYKAFEKMLNTSAPKDSSFYEAAYRCASSTLNAFHSFKMKNQHWYACIEILRTLNNHIEDGVMYYSEHRDVDRMLKNACLFADIHLDEDLKQQKFPYIESLFPGLLLNASSWAVNNRKYDQAIKYLTGYLSTNDVTRREEVYGFLGMACVQTGNYDLAITSLLDAIKLYPDNEKLRDLCIQACIDGKKGEFLQQVVSIGLEKQPDKPLYLSIQGRLLEDSREYKQAANFFQRLEEVEPGQLSTAKHIAICYYNEAVNLFNRAQTGASNEKEARNLTTRARNNFEIAAQRIEEVLASDPSSIKFLKGLGICYLCLKKQDLLESVNNKLRAHNVNPLENTFMPALVSFNDDSSTNFTYSGQIVSDTPDAPPYLEYATSFVQEEFGKWYAKKWDETLAEYEKRVNAATKEAKEKELNELAKSSYIEKYSHQLRINEMQLGEYDPDKEIFWINTNYGPMYVNVPKKNDRHVNFRDNWNANQISFYNAEFAIVDNALRISKMDFVTPSKETYHFNDTDLASAYVPTVGGDGGHTPTVSGQTAHKPVATAESTVYLKSDVDIDIPVNKVHNRPVYALIIANENYAKTSDVSYAGHDGMRIRDYFEKTLGIPAERIEFNKNSTYGEMVSSINKLAANVATENVPPQVLFYYAGHGFPTEDTKDAYLLPVDCDPYSVKETGYSLERLYDKLGDMKADNVVVFMDACFSGSQRNGDPIIEARGVEFEPKEAAPAGNMYVLSAASGRQTALPYDEKQHGLFTYFLLKKLQESKGDVTLGELADYVTTNVTNQSRHKKLQTPVLNTSGSMTYSYKKIKLK